MRIAACLCLLAMVIDEGQTKPLLNDCGVQTLYVAMKVLSPDTTPALVALQKSLAPEREGNTLGELSKEAERHGFSTLIVDTSLEALALRKRPFAFIAHLNRGHFVLLLDADSESATLVDPPRVNVVPRDGFLNEWNGGGMILSTSTIEPEASLQRRLWWKKYWLVTIAVLLAALIGGARALWWRRRRGGQ